MHKDFSEWFIAAGQPQSSDVLEKRWAGIESYEATSEGIIFLTEVFFGLFSNKEAFLSAYRNVFQGEDSSFRMRDNDRELSVLAGATLINIIDDYTSDHADFAALALVSAAAQNLRTAPAVPEIPEYAARYLARRCLNRNKLESQETEGKTPEVIEPKQLRRDLDLVGEETNILWWLFGETSRDSGKRWLECNGAEVSVGAGVELADLTNILPGHAASGAILDRVLRSAKPKSQKDMTVKEFVTEIPQEWREAFVKRRYVQNLKSISPLSCAIERSLVLTDSETLGNSLSTTEKLKKSSKLASHLLSYQMYLECLLAKAWMKVK